MSSKRAKANEALIEALERVSIFSGLPKKTLLQIADLCREHSFDPGDRIVTQGDHSERFYMILEGNAEVAINDHVVNTLGRGQHFGEYALIDGEPRTATVTATTPVRAFSLASITLRPLLKQEAAITYRLLLNACQRLRATQNRFD